MSELTVIDTDCGDNTGIRSAHDDIAGRIVSGIREYGGSLSDVSVECAESYEALKNRTPDILVLGEQASKTVRDPTGRVKCGILLISGDIAADAEGFDAECIITYGMSPKNTITLSSIGEDSCVLAIQREFMTVSGDILERQEIKIRGGIRPSSLLAVSGALLILGLKISIP